MNGNVYDLSSIKKNLTRQKIDWHWVSVGDKLASALGTFTLAHGVLSKDGVAMTPDQVKALKIQLKWDTWE